MLVLVSLLCVSTTSTPKVFQLKICGKVFSEGEHVFEWIVEPETNKLTKNASFFVIAFHHFVKAILFGVGVSLLVATENGPSHSPVFADNQ